MRKNTKTILALLLVLVMSLSLPLTAAAAVKDYEERSPIIVIPGIGQSKTAVYNEDGSVLTAAANEFDLPGLDTKEIVKSLAVPAIKTLISRKDQQLSTAAYDFMYDLFRAYRKNTDGTPVYRTEVKEFNLPYSQLSEEDRKEIDHHITLDGLSDYNDIRYYFTYDCFGSVKEAADRLHDYVHMVLEQTGAKKVSIVPVSQAGVIFVEYLDLYPEDHKLLDRVIGFVAAYDGTVIIGDILTDNVKLYDINYVHETVLPALLGYNDTTYAISLALRAAFTPEALVPVLKNALKAVIECLAINNTMIWAACPDSAYPEAAARLLNDGKHDFIKAEADRFMQARANFGANLDDLIAGGTVIHNVVSYDIPLMFGVLFGHSDTDTDDLLQISSPSIGATAALHGSTLPDDYVAVNPRCTDPTHNHMSPDRKIDASTAYLPENTWFFKGIQHSVLNKRNDMKDIAIQLMINKDITDIYTYEGQSQFIDLGGAPTPSEDKGGFSLLKIVYNISNVVYRMKDSIKIR